MRIAISTLIAAGAFVLAPGAGATEYDGWRVEPTYDEGKFIACSMWGQFEGGTSIGVLVGPDLRWGFSFDHPSWRIKKGQSFDSLVLIDGMPIGVGKAKAMSTSGGIQKLVDGAYGMIQRGRVMEISALGVTTRLNLKGTQTALRAVLDCVRGNTGSGEATAGIRETPAVGASKFVPASEALVMVSNILAATGATGYKIDTPKGNLISWTFADGTRGSFAAVRNFTGNVDEAAGEFLAGGAKDCAGDYASTKQATPTTDGAVIRTVTTACKIDENASVLRTSVVKHGELLLLFSSTVGRNGNPDDGEDARHESRDQAMAQKAVMVLPR